MRPGSLIFWDDKDFGHHRFWRVESVLLGAPGVEGLVRIVSLSHNAGMDENGEKQQTLLVPEVLVRDRVYSKDRFDG